MVCPFYTAQHHLFSDSVNGYHKNLNLACTKVSERICTAFLLRKLKYILKIFQTGI